MTLRSIEAVEAGKADHTSLDELWSCLAYDEAGEWQGYGFGFTPSDAGRARGSTCFAMKVPIPPRTSRSMCPLAGRLSSSSRGVHLVFERL